VDDSEANAAESSADSRNSWNAALPELITAAMGVSRLSTSAKVEVIILSSRAGGGVHVAGLQAEVARFLASIVALRLEYLASVSARRVFRTKFNSSILSLSVTDSTLK
jgi:hypothetical protein